ncbi:MAG: GAF domain-containing sensor histidine kinase, partial [Nitrospiraceae bacterium]
GFLGPLLAGLVWAVAVAYLSVRYPAIGLIESAVIALFPGMVMWLAHAWWMQTKDIKVREHLIREQLEFVDARHEELREAYLVQEQVTVELKRKVGQLTLLHHTGVIVSSTLDREVLLRTALESIQSNLHYDRVMITFYDLERQVSYDARLIGAPADVAAFARSLETPVTDPATIEGGVILRGTPTLITDVREVWDRLHPMTRQLATFTRAQSFISVPLKVQDHVIGTLTVDRLEDHALNEEDLDVMVTVANQLAIALDHAEAYRQIEELNVGLESKVRERTAALEQVNRELHIANGKLRELDQLKSAFVSTVSHELRTPMTSIKAYAENMLDGLVGDLNEKQAIYLKRVKYNTERLTRMINDLLDLSRIEAGRIEVRLGPVSVPDLVSDAVESLQRIAQEKSITLTVRACELPIIRGDKDKLHQVLTNLIQNGIKFTPDGGEITVQSDQPDAGSVRICVEDTGCGIPPHEIEKVFEKFYRADSAPLDARGAGLGLAIAKSFVELHGGRIWAASAEGKGSRFFVTLPATP